MSNTWKCPQCGGGGTHYCGSESYYKNVLKSAPIGDNYGVQIELLTTRAEKAEAALAKSEGEGAVLKSERQEAYKARDAALTKWQGHQKNNPCAGCPGGHDTFWLTVIQSPQWEAWFKHNNTFDVPECEACGHISQEHFQAFMKFSVVLAALPQEPEAKNDCRCNGGDGAIGHDSDCAEAGP
jgi:hypothetical protein